MASEVEELTDPPNAIDPYAVLSVAKDATSDQIKSAYRKAALRHHPDKATPDQRATAHHKFQEIAFAYAILSDTRRRARYDATGRTEESLNDGEDPFDWLAFYRTQLADIVTAASVAAFSVEYKGSQEEREALLAAYEKHEGNMNRVYATVMVSNPVDDDARFRAILDEAIASGEAKAHKKYTHESEKSKKQRLEHYKSEAEEAKELAKELGLDGKLSGKGDGAGAKGESNGQASLAALIQQRQKARAGNFLADLEAKYAPKAGKGKKGKKRGAAELDQPDEPPEEAFQRTAARAAAGKKARTTRKAAADAEEEELEAEPRPAKRKSGRTRAK